MHGRMHASIQSAICRSSRMIFSMQEPHTLRTGGRSTNKNELQQEELTVPLMLTAATSTTHELGGCATDAGDLESAASHLCRP